VTHTVLTNKENGTMKRVLIVVAIAVAMTFAMTLTAFADHSPTFYVEWDAAADHAGYVEDFGNVGTGSPHQNYLEGTEKCAVCHSVHRAPVGPGIKWDTNPADEASRTKVAGGQYNRQEFETVGTAPAQMLLQTTVANSCDYCHILTSTGGKQLYAGKTQYRTEGTGLAGAEWDAGFAHHNGCTGCHVVHGVGNNYGNAALWGAKGIFEGPLETKVLKLRAKGTGGAVGTAAAYNWQDETVAIGSAGQAEFGASGIAGAAAWAAAQTPADYIAGEVRPLDPDFSVDPMNVPLFPSATDAIMGTNVRPGTDAAAAQSAVFCTFCHVNYGYASEATVNPDGDRGLFQGPWYALVGTVPNVTGTAGAFTTANGAGAYGMPFKNHPVKSVYGTFAAAGKTTSVAQVAFTGAETCVSCHDAGASTGADGVLIQSYPHFTPGYFHFTKSAAHAGATMTNGPVEAGLIPNVVAAGDTAGLASVQAWLEDPVNYEEAVTVADGQCLKCHVDTTDTLGIGKTF